MKTRKFLAVAILLLSSFSLFLTSCSDDETKTEYIDQVYGCMDNTAVNYDPSANVAVDSVCIYPSQLDDTTRTVYTAEQHTADATLKPWNDHTHSTLTWKTDYRDMGVGSISGRFVNFGLVEPMTFNEKTPTLEFKAWAQISSIFTGEPGRDAPETGCMPRDLGVRWYTHEEISGTDTTIVQDSIVENSDFAYLETTGNAEFYFATNKRGFTTSYRVPAKLKYKEQNTAVNDGPLYESDVTVYFNYGGRELVSGAYRSGIYGYFEFYPKADHAVVASSCGEMVLMNFDMMVRY